MFGKNNDEGINEYLRKATQEQLKASMPTEAARFFTRHPELLESFRWQSLGELAKSREINNQYLNSMPPEVMWSLVTEMAEVIKQVQGFSLAMEQVKDIGNHKSTYDDDLARFTKSGINVHLSADQFKYLIRAMASHHGEITDSIETGTPLFEDVNPEVEHNLNHSTGDHLVDTLRGVYPTLVLPKQ